MAGRKHCKDKRSNLRSRNLIGVIWGDRDDLDDVMETSLTTDYHKQWLNYVSAIGPKALTKKMEDYSCLTVIMNAFT